MSKPIATQVSSQQFSRERGAAIPVTSQQIRLADGTYARTVKIDISKAMSPDRSYPAELAGAVYEKGSVKLLFGQGGRNGIVRSLIEVALSPTAACQLLEVVGTLSPSIEEIFQLTCEDMADLTVFLEDPREVAMLKANMVAMAFSGSEASIDFYNTSPFSMGRIQSGSASSANVDGVVRIDTKTALVYALVLKVRELVGQFPPKFKELMEGIK